MKNLLKIAFILALFLSYNIEAQEVVKKDTIGGTPLSITMDKNVQEVIEKMEENCSMANNRKSERNYNNTNDDYNYRTSNSVATTPKTVVKVVPNRALTNAEICRQNPRILGYKIQLTVVKSNEEANEVKAYFRRRFPNLKVETDASLRPNYKILAGSYFTKQSAAGDLAKIRQFFKSATPVQYRIFCVEAK